MSQSNAREAGRASVPRTTTRGRWSPNRSPSASKGCLPRGWRYTECRDQSGEHRDGSGISATAGRKPCNSAELLHASPASAVSDYAPAWEASPQPHFPAAPGRLTWQTNDPAIPPSSTPGERKPHGRTQSKCAACVSSACGCGPERPVAPRDPTVRTHSRPIPLRARQWRC